MIKVWTPEIWGGITTRHMRYEASAAASDASNTAARALSRPTPDSADMTPREAKTPNKRAAGMDNNSRGGVAMDARATSKKPAAAPRAKAMGASNAARNAERRLTYLPLTKIKDPHRESTQTRPQIKRSNNGDMISRLRSNPLARRPHGITRAPT